MLLVQRVEAVALRPSCRVAPEPTCQSPCVKRAPPSPFPDAARPTQPTDGPCVVQSDGSPRWNGERPWPSEKEQPLLSINSMPFVSSSSCQRNRQPRRIESSHIEHIVQVVSSQTDTHAALWEPAAVSAVSATTNETITSKSIPMRRNLYIYDETGCVRIQQKPETAEVRHHKRAVRTMMPTHAKRTREKKAKKTGNNNKNKRVAW